MKMFSFLRTNLLRILLFLISAFFLILFFYHIGKSDGYSALFSTLMSGKFSLLLSATTLMIISLFIKAYRYYILIKPSNPFVRLVPFFPVFFVGYGISVLGPLKSGEIASVEINKRGLNISRSSSFAAIVFFRLLDVYFVLLFFLFSLFYTVPKLLQFEGTTILYIILLVCVAVTIVMSIFVFSPPFGKLLYAILFFLTNKINKKSGVWLEINLLPFLNNYYNSLKFLYSQSYILIIVLISTLIRWLIEFYAFYLTLLAFSASISFLDVSSISAITIIIGIISFAPAGLGTGTLSSQLLLEQLGILSAIAGAAILFQTLIGPGLSIFAGSLSSPFLPTTKDQDVPTTTEPKENIDQL